MPRKEAKIWRQKYEELANELGGEIIHRDDALSLTSSACGLLRIRIDTIRLSRVIIEPIYKDFHITFIYREVSGGIRVVLVRHHRRHPGAGVERE